MKKNILITLLAALLLSSCGEYNKLLKSTDYEYKYEAAKNYFAKGQYNRAATLLNELIAILKGTDKAEESLYMLGMSYYNQKDYQTAAQTFIQYYNVYPRGTFTELARFHAGKALYLDTPEPRLDQSGTYSAIQQLQMFMEYFPQSSKKEEAQNMIFALQDKLVMKEYLSAKLYYNMGNYLGNNYQACVITAQNALKDYPYTNITVEQHGKAIDNKFDYGIAGGAGIELRTKAGNFIVEGRYYYALSDFYGSTKKDFFSRSAHGVITAKVTYLFDLKK
jgi:outer membrane protein assembly factor BamD